jgi:hypothetical protein
MSACDSKFQRSRQCAATSLNWSGPGGQGCRKYYKGYSPPWGWQLCSYPASLGLKKNKTWQPKRWQSVLPTFSCFVPLEIVLVISRQPLGCAGLLEQVKRVPCGFSYFEGAWHDSKYSIRHCRWQLSAWTRPLFCPFAQPRLFSKLAIGPFPITGPTIGTSKGRGPPSSRTALRRALAKSRADNPEARAHLQRV